MYLNDEDRVKLLSESKHVLFNLVIDKRGPGTILRDFDIMLEAIKKKGLPLTPAAQLQISAVTDINEQLTHPLEIGLKRAQQKSYPNVLGLFLLARASGLARIDQTGKKLLLRLDDEIYQQWTRLNPTEQYCTLLESWFIRGKEEIIGGDRRMFGQLPENFFQVARFMNDIPAKGLSVSGKRDVEEWIRFRPGWHNLGLVDLFGLVRIEEGPVIPGQGWHIKAVQRTEVGSALISALYSDFFANLSNVFEVEDEFEREGKVPVGVLQPVLQRYFPDWKNNLTFPELALREGVYIFKVSLGAAWRRIAIESRDTLDDLASQILIAFDFDNDHLYEFSWRNRFGSTEMAIHPEAQDGISAADVLIGNVPINVGQTMRFLFDFGDNWEFDVKLEQIDSDKVVKKLGIIEEHGKGPEQYPGWDDEDDDDYEDGDIMIDIF